MTAALLALSFVIWFWLDSLRANEIARAAGARACLDAGLQFLDETASVKLAVRRLVLQRTYRFEFSDTGDRRLEGEVILVGKRVASLTLEPYRFH
ncbi:MAG TPA: DUF3301 domain-containing protein [Burkholderiales bacterium]|nr:DUF3301 domain-containing protein [Burkholderiales bacterium]